MSQMTANRITHGMSLQVGIEKERRSRGHAAEIMSRGSCFVFSSTFRSSRLLFVPVANCRFTSAMSHDMSVKPISGKDHGPSIDLLVVRLIGSIPIANQVYNIYTQPCFAEARNVVTQGIMLAPVASFISRLDLWFCRRVMIEVVRAASGRMPTTTSCSNDARNRMRKIVSLHCVTWVLHKCR